MGCSSRQRARGVLTYSPMTVLKAAAVRQFKGVVTDIGRGAQRTKLAKSNGMDVYQRDVPTGGAVPPCGISNVARRSSLW